MTIGDVQGTIAMIAGTAGALWAAELATAALFGEKARRVADQIERQPGRSFWTGFGLLISAGVVGLVLVNQPFGPLKLVGWAMLAGLFALAVLGSTGLATLAARRIQMMDSRLSYLGAVGRGAAFLIAAGLLPFLGTFLLFPAMFCFSVGGGIRAMLDKRGMREAVDPILPTTVYAPVAGPVTPVAPTNPGYPSASQHHIAPDGTINQNVGR